MRLLTLSAATDWIDAQCEPVVVSDVECRTSTHCKEGQRIEEPED
jgi:hypothetical protein